MRPAGDPVAISYGSDGGPHYICNRDGPPRIGHHDARTNVRRMYCAGTRRCKRGHPPGAVILKPCKFAVATIPV